MGLAALLMLKVKAQGLEIAIAHAQWQQTLPVLQICFKGVSCRPPPACCRLGGTSREPGRGKQEKDSGEGSLPAARRKSAAPTASLRKGLVSRSDFGCAAAEWFGVGVYSWAKGAVQRNRELKRHRGHTRVGCSATFDRPGFKRIVNDRHLWKFSHPCKNNS